MREHLLKEELCHCDETPIQVLREEGRKNTSKSWMWVYSSAAISRKPIRIFQYAPGRGSRYPKAFLEGFEGFLVTDGYGGYSQIEDRDRSCRGRKEVPMVRQRNGEDRRRKGEDAGNHRRAENPYRRDLYRKVRLSLLQTGWRRRAFQNRSPSSRDSALFCEPGRGSRYPKAFLEGFEGFLVTDGYGGYSQIENTKRALCWAHVRRKFFEALPSSGKNIQETEAYRALERIGQIFHVETELQKLEPARRAKERDRMERGTAACRKSFCVGRRNN